MKAGAAVQNPPNPLIAVTVCLDLTRHTLEDYRGKRLMISFFRYAACPYCNLAVQALSRRYAEWEAGGLTILAFFQSEGERVERIVGKQGVPFPMIGEPEREVSAGRLTCDHERVWRMRGWDVSSLTALPSCRTESPRARSS